MATHKRKIFINLGANIGQDIVSFKNAKGQDFYSWEIFAFEPLPSAIKIFEENIIDTNVKLIKKAVTTTDEIRNFYLGAISVSGSLRSDKTTLMQGPLNIPKKYRKKIKVRTIDFSKWVKDNISSEDYVIVYMDIEGYEYDILNKMISEKTIYLIDKLYVEWHGNKLWKFKIENEEILITKLKKIFGDNFHNIDF